MSGFPTALPISTTTSTTPSGPGFLRESDIPREISYVLGESHRERINTLVTDMISQTAETGQLGMRPQVSQAMNELRSFLFARVYKNPVAKGEEAKARGILQALYTYYTKHPEALPADFIPQLDFDGMGRVICDYIAGMTDKYAVHTYETIFIPAAWHVRD